MDDERSSEKMRSRYMSKNGWKILNDKDEWIYGKKLYLGDLFYSKIVINLDNLIVEFEGGKESGRMAKMSELSWKDVNLSKKYIDALILVK